MSGDNPVEFPTTGLGVGDVGEVIRFDVVAHGSDAVVIHVVGEVDTLTAPALRAQLDEHIPKTPLVVLDLTEVSFLGSVGLAVMVAAEERARAIGHTLRVVCGSRIVTRALEATGLLGMFDIAEGVPEALAVRP